jgi:hypothetical protein
MEDGRNNENPMTQVTVSLPDDLARDAQQAGLLSPQRLEPWLRDQLAKAARIDQMFAEIGRMTKVPDPNPMLLEEVAEEIRKMRAEQRAARRLR